MTYKAALIILDGWGIGKTDEKINAIYAAHTPFFDALMLNEPNAKLKTSGGDVGLPAGQMGNSEVGHLNIGAGRVVYQMLALINKAFDEGEINEHPVLLNAFSYAKNNEKNTHFIGLVSDGGVHSHINHLKGLCSLAAQHQMKNVFIHAFTDGRDTDPNGGLAYLTDLQNHLSKTTGKIASVTGRYYAMDRDKRWERTKLAWEALVNAEGEKTTNVLEAVKKNYDTGITDEFIKPIIAVDEDGVPLSRVRPGDVIIFFNFRTDRGRQLTQALTQTDFPDFGMHELHLHYITFTQYDKTYKDVKILFEEQDLVNTIGETLERRNLTQLRMAETEKYPHVTFFFSGGREENYKGEERIMAASPKVATYDLQPEMSAPELTEKAITALQETKPDFFVLNYANPDMVGHTGVFSAVVRAVETVDACAEKLCGLLKELGYKIIIIADHGNADFMVNDDGSPNTAHSTNPVPVILIASEKKYSITDGRLADIAPTLLALMGIEKSAEMTGVSLLKS